MFNLIYRGVIVPMVAAGCAVYALQNGAGWDAASAIAGGVSFGCVAALIGMQP